MSPVARFSDMEKLNETRMALLLGKIEDIDNRLARLEQRFARLRPYSPGLVEH